MTGTWHSLHINIRDHSIRIDILPTRKEAILLGSKILKQNPIIESIEIKRFYQYGE